MEQQPVANNQYPTSDNRQPALRIWWTALTQPAEATFVEFLKGARAMPGRAYLWVGLASAAGYVASLLITALLTALRVTGASAPRAAIGGTVIAAFCGLPVVVGLSLLGFLLTVGIIYLTAKVLRSEAAFADLVYTVSTFHAPLTFIAMILSAIPLLRYANILVWLYWVILLLMATRAIYGFSWGKAIVAVIVPWLLISILIGCAFIGLLTLVGPMVQDNFNEIIENLEGGSY